jgi:hypothetical protein
MVGSHSMHLEATITRVIQYCCTHVAHPSYCPVTSENCVDCFGMFRLLCVARKFRCTIIASAVQRFSCLSFPFSKHPHADTHHTIFKSIHITPSECVFAVLFLSSRPLQAPAMSQSPESSTSLLCAVSTPLAAPLTATPTCQVPQLHPIALNLASLAMLPLSMLTSRRTVSSKITRLYVRY